MAAGCSSQCPHMLLLCCAEAECGGEEGARRGVGGGCWSLPSVAGKAWR